MATSSDSESDSFDAVPKNEKPKSSNYVSKSARGSALQISLAPRDLPRVMKNDDGNDEIIQK